MIKAEKRDKPTVIDILVKAFANNRSVNYLIKQDRHKEKRLIALLDYSFEYCMLFGDVFLSPSKDACALIVYPEKVRFSLKSSLLSYKLIKNCIGLNNIKKALSRESVIKKIHKDHSVACYLWFIGVDPSVQREGKGSALLEELIGYVDKFYRNIFLETSVETNLTWYRKFGFAIYHRLDFGYELFCLKRDKQ